jgi:putative ABC transport system permease protein
MHSAGWAIFRFSGHPLSVCGQFNGKPFRPPLDFQSLTNPASSSHATKQNHYLMLLHYIRIAIRNLAKQKHLTVINVAGLSLGLACFSLILLYAVNAFSYDRFQKNAARIYRVNEIYTRDDGSENGEYADNMPMGPALEKEFPDVAHAIRISNNRETVMKVDDQITRIPLSFADPAVFSVFTFPLLAGNPGTALKAFHSIVLTRSRAIQLFGKTDVIGKTVQIKVDTVFQPFVVSAVAKDVPANTNVSFDILGSYRFLEAAPDRQSSLNNWNRSSGDQTYVLLVPGSHLMNEPGRLLDFRLRHYGDEAAAYQKSKKAQSRFSLQPLREVHTNAKINGPNVVDAKNIWILLAIATGILLIASINFTTLAISRSAGRAREVGVRKVVGGLRHQLIGQFLIESVLLTILSAGLGLILAYALLPWFNQLSGTSLAFSFRRFPELAWMLCGLILLVGVLAGSYPALILSGFNPVNVLRKKIRLGGANLFTRSLVTVQFALSIGLIITTVIMLRQVGYLQSRDLGLIKENTIVVNAADANTVKIYALFRQKLQSDKDILGVAASEIGLGEGEGEMGELFDFGNDKKGGAIEYPVDHAFVPVLGMKLLAGRNFDPAISSDSAGSVIVNEALLEADFGLSPQKAVGLQFKSGKGAEVHYKTIIGVVRDFNFEPLTRKVRPQFFYMPAEFKPERFFVRVRGGDPSASLAAIGAAWTEAVPDLPFRYYFLDENLDKFYQSEVRWRNIMACAGGISIFLACLGLFGLALLAAANRVREIGIRKILGASVIEIIQLLTSGFLRLVLLAFLIASPVAWYLMHHWLQNFAYRIDIGWTVFAVTALLALGIAFLTIGIQAYRSARANPVKNIRIE